MYGVFRLQKLGFIGAGKIVEVLAKGFIAGGILQINQVFASAPTDKEIEWIRHLGCKVTLDNKKILEENPLVILAVKPQILPRVLKDIAPVVTSDHLLVSVAAGLKLDTIQRLLPEKSRVARIMTNTPVMFRQGVSAFSMGKHTTDQDHEVIYKLMSSVGCCVEVKEDLMDTVTGFAGGGPAYLYTVIEALADGAVRGGMSRTDAVRMAAQMTLGAARMVQETGLHTGELRDAVCSPGGTSIVGVDALERGCLRGTLIDAVVAASNRAKELGELFNGHHSNTKNKD